MRTVILFVVAIVLIGIGLVGVTEREVGKSVLLYWMIFAVGLTLLLTALIL